MYDRRTDKPGSRDFRLFLCLNSMTANHQQSAVTVTSGKNQERNIFLKIRFALITENLAVMFWQQLLIILSRITAIKNYSGIGRTGNHYARYATTRTNKGWKSPARLLVAMKMVFRLIQIIIGTGRGG